MFTIRAVTPAVTFALCVAAGQSGAQQVLQSTTRLDSVVPTNERTIIDALRGRVPGARIVTTSGVPGSVPTLVIRNAGMNHYAAPIVVIDGVVSRLTLADLNVNDVAGVDVLKGAATATEYGPGAANGVILITTRRAADSAGHTLSLRSDFGINSPPGFPSAATHHPFQLTADSTGFVVSSFGNRLVDPDLIIDNPFPLQINNRSAIVGDRSVFTNHLGFSQRWPATAAFVSLSHDRDPGITTRLDGLERSQGRLKLEHSLFADRLRIAGAAFLATSRNDAPPTMESWFSVLPLIEPWFPLDSAASSCPAGNDCYQPVVPIGVFNGTNPLLQREATPTRARGRRTNGSLFLRYGILGWLAAEGSLATDRRRATLRADFEPAFAGSMASRLETGDTARVSTTTLALVARRSFRANTVHSHTRFGFTEEQQRHELHEFLGSDVAYTSSGLMARVKTTNVTLSTEVDLGDRLTLDGALSRVGIRTFDVGYSPNLYHRFGAGWRVGDRYRVRAGYGTATPVSRGIDEAQVAFFRLDTRPSFAREFEAAIDVALPRDARFIYTHSRQRTAGQFLPIPFVVLPFPTFHEWRVIGSTLGYAHEFSLEVPVIRRDGRQWNVAIAAHHARARVENLEGPQQAYLFDHSIITPGSRVGVIWGQRWIRTPEQLQQALASGQLSGTGLDYVMNEEGYFVRQSDWGTPSERPLPATYPCDPDGPCPGFGWRHPIGDQNADLEFGITNDARIGVFAVSATFTGVLGGDIVNYQRQIAVRTGRDPMADQSARPIASRKPYGYYGTLGGTPVPNETFIESATHVKLRGLSVDWRVPPRLASRVGVNGRAATVGLTGRNLWTSGSYHGYDPDVVTTSSRVTDMRVDRALYPAYRSIALRVGIGVD